MKPRSFVYNDTVFQALSEETVRPSVFSYSVSLTTINMLKLARTTVNVARTKNAPEDRTLKHESTNVARQCNTRTRTRLVGVISYILSYVRDDDIANSCHGCALVEDFYAGIRIRGIIGGYADKLGLGIGVSESSRPRRLLPIVDSLQETTADCRLDSMH